MPENLKEITIPSTGEIPPFRVLLIDDDAALLRVLTTTIKRFFRDRILQISQHTSGHAGLDEAMAHPFDIVLLDLTLPDIHGLELLRIFKSSPRTRDMSVVILSGSMDREDIDQSFALDAEDYILKPFEPIRLNTRIQSIMRTRKALTDLQRAQSRLTNILDSLGAVVWSFCPKENRLIYCGGAPTEVYGLSSEKLLENPALWPSLLHPADQDRVLKAYRNLEGSDFGNHEYRILDAKGRTHWLSERFLAVTDDLGNPVRIEGITTDVTTIKARELALRQARKFAENLAENSLDMIIGVDGMRRITEFNKAAEETFQYSREEVLGEPVTLLYQNADIHAQIHEEVYKAGRFYGEVINTRKDGTFFTALLSATPILDLEGRVCGMIGISRDITERKKREALLTLLESAVSHLEESIMITNAPDQDRLPRVVFVNSAFQKTTGYPPPEVIGMHPDLLLGPQSDRDAFQAVENSLRAGKPSVARTVNYRKDGSQFLARWHASPVPDEVGTIRHWVFILLDITEHSKVQEELEQSRKLRAIGEIAGGVAHEFSNLLSPMLIQTGLISRTYPDDAVLNDMLRPIRTAIKQAASLNQSILTLGRKSSDKRDIMSLNSIVEESAKLFSSTGDQRIQLSLDLSPDLHPIWLVRSQISQIVINLGFNARDTLMEKLDRLAIQSDMDDWIPEIHVCTKLVHDVMDKRAQSPKQRRIDCQCLSIQDNGLGMSAETRNRLFEPFFTTKEGGKGTGLGMAVVWNLVDLLGGWIEVESTLGSGTRFDIFFPQYVSGIPTALTQVPQEFQATWQGAETLRILFVEDNPGSSAKTVE